jgi:N-dimethylarginine dimethylaminohydrolase
MPSRVLLCPPTYFEVRDRKNPYMRQPVDHAKAQYQWETLCDAFRSVGFKLEFIAPIRDLEDMVFAANQVFVGCDETLGRFVIPSEMRYPSRQKEVPHYVDWFYNRGYKILALDLRGEFLEGGGDLLWHPDRSRIWAGYGIRSSLAGVTKFAEAMSEMEVTVTTLQLADEYFYHLDTCLAPLNSEAALYYPGAFSEDAQQNLASGWKRLYPVTRDEALRFVCNGVAANGAYIAPVQTPSLEQALQKENIRLVLVDTSEFEKSGGSVFCMKMFLD